MGQYPSARAAAYADDGFVRDTLLTVLRILAALKHAFKEDLGMELTLPKCKVLIPGLSQEDALHGSPLQLPPLKSLAQPDSSGPADGTAATSSRLPKQKRITKQIMPHWKPHKDSTQQPPDEFCKHLRDLHLTQVIEAAPDAEAGDPRHSILTACMSDGDKSRKLHFTPAAWLSCLSTSDGVSR